MFNRKRKAASPDEKAYIATVKAAGCICCLQLTPKRRVYAEFNHHNGARGRLGHTVGTGECIWHHRGEPDDGFSKAQMLERYGPSRKYPGSRPFHARFGSDADLLEQQKKVLEDYDGEF